MQRSETILQLVPPLAVAALGLLLLAVPGAAGSDTGAAVERGEVSYRVYCLNCHGVEARGDGPMAEVLKVRPADLTRLRTEADGTFPREELREVIDGRRDVLGHGRREMPIWGLAFRERGRDSDQEAEVRARIDDLLAFLESIQVPEE